MRLERLSPWAWAVTAKNLEAVAGAAVDMFALLGLKPLKSHAALANIGPPKCFRFGGTSWSKRLSLAARRLYAVFLTFREPECVLRVVAGGSALRSAQCQCNEAQGENATRAQARRNATHKLHQHVQPDLAVVERNQFQRTVADFRLCNALTACPPAQPRRSSSAHCPAPEGKWNGGLADGGHRPPRVRRRFSAST